MRLASVGTLSPLLEASGAPLSADRSTDVDVDGPGFPSAEMVVDDAVAVVAHRGDPVAVPGIDADVPATIVVAPNTVGIGALRRDGAASGGDINGTAGAGASMRTIDAMRQRTYVCVNVGVFGGDVDVPGIDVNVTGAIMVVGESVRDRSLCRDGVLALWLPYTPTPFAVSITVSDTSRTIWPAVVAVEGIQHRYPLEQPPSGGRHPSESMDGMRRNPHRLGVSMAIRLWRCSVLYHRKKSRQKTFASSMQPRRPGKPG